MNKNNEDNTEIPPMPLLSLVLCKTIMIAHQDDYKKCDNSGAKKTKHQEAKCKY